MSSYRALVDALYVSSGDDAEDRRITSRTLVLLESRISGASPLFRTGIRLTTLLFNLSALLTHGRLFSLMSAEDRRGHCLRAAAWAGLPFGDLLRLVRTITLLATYDDFGVRSRIGLSADSVRNNPS